MELPHLIYSVENAPRTVTNSHSHKATLCLLMDKLLAYNTHASSLSNFCWLSFLEFEECLNRGGLKKLILALCKIPTSSNQNIFQNNKGNVQKQRDIKICYNLSDLSAHRSTKHAYFLFCLFTIHDRRPQCKATITQSLIHQVFSTFCEF